MSAASSRLQCARYIWINSVLFFTPSTCRSTPIDIAFGVNGLLRGCGYDGAPNEEMQFLGAGVAHRLCNGLPRDGPGFNYRLGQYKNRASRLSQGTVNGVSSINDLAVDGTLIINTTNQQTITYTYQSGRPRFDTTDVFR